MTLSKRTGRRPRPSIDDAVRIYLANGGAIRRLPDGPRVLSTRLTAYDVARLVRAN